jgi:hypothetical protein
MKIEKQNYSHGAWRLLTDSGKQVCTTLKNGAGDVVATGQPVCGQTKAEVMNYALAELERIAYRNIELEAQNRTIMGLLEKYVKDSELNVCA